MIAKRQMGGILPQFQTDTIKTAYATKAHNVDLSSNSIRPAQSITRLMSIGDANKISFQRDRLIWSGGENDVHHTSNVATFLWGSNGVFIDRSISGTSSPSEPFQQFPVVSSLNAGSDGDTVDVCTSDYTAYRIRYLSQYGELSNVLAISDFVQDNNGQTDLSWTATNVPTTGTWIIERVEVPYQQLSNQSTQEYKDNFFVVGEAPITSVTYTDTTPVGSGCDTIPTYIDAFHIDQLNVDIGIVTDQGEMVTALRGDSRIYISYPNKPHLFPYYNVIETGSPIMALVYSPNGCLVFHQYGTGVLAREKVSQNDLLPNSYYSYQPTSINTSLINADTISVRNNIVYYMSDLGLVMYPQNLSVSPNAKVVTFDIMADAIGNMDETLLVGQAYEDGYYLTDGETSYVITNLDTFYIDADAPVVRTTSIVSRVVTQYKDGSLAFYDNGVVYLTKFRYRVIDPRTSPIYVQIFGEDDRGSTLVYERDVLHSDTFTVRNSFQYKKYAIELQFGGTDRASHDCIYKTKVSLTDGLKSFGRCRIVRDVTEETLRITDIGLMSRVHQFLSLKPT